MLQLSGRPGEAIPFYRRGIAGYEGGPPESASDLAVATGGLASLLEQSGDYVGAKLLYERAVAAAVTSLGAEHPQTVRLKRQMEGLLVKMADSHLN